MIEMNGIVPPTDFSEFAAKTTRFDWELVQANVDRSHPHCPWKKRNLPEGETGWR